MIDLGEYTFYGCSNLEEINIPSKVTEINSGVFLECPKLKTLEIPKTVTHILGNEYMPFDKEITLKVYANSYAEKYAKNNGLNYIVLGEAKWMKSGNKW